ncbi:MAG: hypothetical protein IJ275_03505 [Ruminococcus sp.]|nr:hypothetical protein [Ruminococcus sp.]
MNCPNCGGLLNLEKRYCEYCNTTFTEAELGLTNADKISNTDKPVEPERVKSRTEQMQEQLEKDRKNDKNTADTSARDIATGAAIMGIFGMFSGVRMFFRNLKRTVCLIILVLLEVGFAFLMISGEVTKLMEGELQGLVAVNVLILVNALLAGIISRIGYIRAGTAITAVVNFLAVVWVFVYPMITSDFAGQTPQSVAIIAVVEMAVLALSVLLSQLIYRR